MELLFWLMIIVAVMCDMIRERIIVSVRRICSWIDKPKKLKLFWRSSVDDKDVWEFNPR
jgi:hypothetical protein